MFRNWYEGISQDKHLKQKRKSQRFRSIAKRVYIKKWGDFVLIGICCSIRVRKGSMLIHKIDKLHSHSILYSLEVKVSIACFFFEPSAFVNKKTKTLAPYHTVEGFSPTFSDFS